MVLALLQQVSSASSPLLVQVPFLLPSLRKGCIPWLPEAPVSTSSETSLVYDDSPVCVALFSLPDAVTSIYIPSLPWELGNSQRKPHVIGKGELRPVEGKDHD